MLLEEGSFHSYERTDSALGLGLGIDRTEDVSAAVGRSGLGALTKGTVEPPWVGS